MSTPNPLMPEGTLPGSKGKSNVRIAVFTILAIHVVLLGGLLMQGCKRGEKPAAETANADTVPVADLAPLSQSSSNELPIEQLPSELPGATTTATPNVAPIGTPAAAPVNASVANPVVNTAANLAAAPAPAVPAAAPFAATPSTPIVTGEMKTHTVAKGENYSTIGKQYRVTARAIEEANPGVNPTRLQLGQVINIPAPAPATVASVAAPAAPDISSGGDTGAYVVKSGDALEKIARRNGTTVKEIKALNNLRTDRITVGQKLILPAKKMATLEAAAPAPTTNR